MIVYILYELLAVINTALSLLLCHVNMSEHSECFTGVYINEVITEEVAVALLACGAGDSSGNH